MKRTDIRNGTLYIIVFSILAFATIFALRKIPEADEPVKPQIVQTQCWSDTLSNSSCSLQGLDPFIRDVERMLSKFDIAGMSVSIVRNDSLLFTQGFGYSDKEMGVKMETSSIMRIASASKLVTAAAIMKLREEGKLTLDSKIFGPDGILGSENYNDSIGDNKIFDITVDHLLQHKGGFTLGAGDPMFNTADIIKTKHLNAAPSNDELVSIVLKRRIAQPGASRHYSNFGYFILSLVVEKLSGKDYWSYVEEHVLRPAGCDMFRPATNYYADRLPGEVKYYGPDKVPVEEYNGSGKMVERVYGGSNVNGLLGAGGWLTSSAGFARFVASIDGRPEVKDILNAESIRLLTEFDGDEKLLRGWSEGDGKGRLTRTGTLSSTHALIQQYADGTLIVILTNTGVWTGHHFSRDLSRFADRIHTQYLPAIPGRNLW